MCLAVPMKITEINGNRAVCELDGLSRGANLSLLPGANVGDYVIIHAGFAIQKLDVRRAEETLSQIRKSLEKT